MASLPVILQICLALRFLATGTFLELVADTVSVAKSTAWRAVHQVCDSLTQLVGEYVYFGETARLKQQFFAKRGFPNCIGAIDGTQVRIQRPTENEHVYVNRKGFHAINVQAVCDANFRILDVCARWPGSAHDSRIFRESGLRVKLEDGDLQGCLIGDSGYPCMKYLMTPFLNPRTPAEIRFNEALCGTRVCVEQTFGILKRRFHGLHDELRMSPQRACKVVTACAVLHNFAILEGDILLPPPVPPDQDDPVDLADGNGQATRQHIVRTFFT